MKKDQTYLERALEEFDEAGDLLDEEKAK